LRKFQPSKNDKDEGGKLPKNDDFKGYFAENATRYFIFQRNFSK